MYNTIIIGGGISGLSCAKELSKKSKDFLLITEDIGGRILESKDEVQYGAYYIMNNYNHVKTYVSLKKIINPFSLRFNSQKAHYSILNLRLLINSYQLIKYIILLKEFKNHYEKFKINCLNYSQKEALHKDKFLLDLYNKNAEDYIKEHKLKSLKKDYISQLIYGTTFTTVDKLNEFSLLQFTLPIITPFYEFHFEKEKLISNFKRNIKVDTVKEVKIIKDGYQVKTTEDIYLTKNLVVATPLNISKKLLNLKAIKKPVNTNMFLVKGKCKLDGQINLFSSNSDILVIAKQSPELYLFYSKSLSPDFEKYFENYQIVDKKEWKPAFNLEGNTLIECKQGDNLFLIGDYNICGLEDSFITGIYAAREIIKNS